MRDQDDTKEVREQPTLPGLLANQIVAYLRDQGMVSGDHIPAQQLADFLGVSRSPINKALKILEDHRIVRREPQRGYFLDREASIPTVIATNRTLEVIYFRIAEDRLSGKIPDTVSEAMLRNRYGVTQGELSGLLTRMVREGWIERRKGYGWRFSTMLTTSDALEQTYRLRAALEPAALLEPTFHIDPATLDRLEQVERRLIAGEIETAPADKLYESGVVFHETLAQASGNPYIVDSLHRVNQIRRLLAYRSMVVRSRHYKQSEQHLEIIALLRRGYNAAAADAMRHHLNSVILNLQALGPVLPNAQAETPDTADHVPKAR